MSKSDKDQDWEKVLSKLTSENEKSSSQTGAAPVGILAFILVNAISALAVMVLNSTVNRAWENIEAFQPGIGYVDAFAFSGLVWVLFLLKIGISSAVGSSNDNS